MAALFECPEMVLAGRPLSLSASRSRAWGRGVGGVVGELLVAGRADDNPLVIVFGLGAGVGAGVTRETVAGGGDGFHRGLRAALSGTKGAGEVELGSIEVGPHNIRVQNTSHVLLNAPGKMVEEAGPAVDELELNEVVGAVVWPRMASWGLLVRGAVVASQTIGTEWRYLGRLVRQVDDAGDGGEQGGVASGKPRGRNAQRVCPPRVPGALVLFGPLLPLLDGGVGRFGEVDDGCGCGRRGSVPWRRAAV